MGFFDLKVKCAICEKEVGLNRFQLKKDVWICPDCLSEAGGMGKFAEIKNLSIDELKFRINGSEIARTENIKRINEFNPTKKIGNYFFVDEEKRQWAIPDGVISGKIKKAKIFNYSDIVNFELIEDGNSITKGGLGRAVAGGLLFGGAGAIVGGVTGGKKSKSTCLKLQIKITVNDMNDSTKYINFINSETKKDSIVYKTAFSSAQEILSILQLMCDTNKNNETNNSNNSNTSVAEEIRKFKQLADDGIITIEEFESKKKELLNL